MANEDTDSLSQNEINDLISGGTPTDSGEGSLLEAMGVAGGGHAAQKEGDKKYRPYKLGEQRGLISKKHDKAMESLHQQMARSLETSLSGMLGVLIDLNYDTIDTLTFSDYIMSLSEVSCLGRVRSPGYSGVVIVEVGLELVFPIVEKLLGGKGATATPNTRRLTAIERKIIERLFYEVLESMTSVWQQLKPDVSFVLDSIETDTDAISGGAQGEQMTYVVISVKFANVQGKISLCYSSSVIEPILSESTLEEFGDADDIEDQEREFSKSKVKNRAYKTNVWVRAVLPKTLLPMRDLSELKVGSMIELDTKVRNKQIVDPIIVEVEKNPRFYARLGRFEKNRAVKVTGLYEEAD